MISENIEKVLFVTTLLIGFYLVLKPTPKMKTEIWFRRCNREYQLISDYITNSRSLLELLKAEEYIRDFDQSFRGRVEDHTLNFLLEQLQGLANRKEIELK